MKPDESGFASLAAWTRAEGEVADWEIPTQRYREDAEIGRGGMGVVFAVTDHWLQRQVAQKRPHDPAPAEVRRMLREATITCGLNHPSIPPIFDVGEDDEGAYYTMPILRGRALADSLSDLPLVEAVRALQIAGEALGYAHEHGIVHRDVKPANLLLGTHGEVWVVDWGVAWDANEPDSHRVGTPGFMAPEQQRGHCSPASDVYALGTILGLVLETHADPALSAVTERARSADPNLRYPHGGAFSEELRRWLTGQRVLVYDYGPREILGRWAREHRVLLAVVTAAAALLVIGLVLAVRVQLNANAEIRSALAQSVSLRASAHSRRGLRAEAEELAVQALALEDSPEARGVLVRWAGSPSVEWVGSGVISCEGAAAVEGGGWYCPMTRTVHSSFGEPVLTVVDHQEAVDLTQDVRVVGEVVVSSPPVRAIHEDALVQFLPDGERQLLSMGSRTVFTHGTSLFEPDPGLRRVARRWDDICPDQVNRLVADPERILVGCRGQVSVFEGDERRVLAEGMDVSAVAWAGEVVVANYQGELFFESTPDRLLSTGGRAATVMEAIGDDKLVMLTESGRMRVLHVPSRTWIAELPSDADDLMVLEGGIRWFKDDEYRDYSVPAGLRGTELDLSAFGGANTAALSLDGQDLAVGNANGSVLLWNQTTQSLSMPVSSGTNVAKSMAYSNEGVLWVSNGQVYDVNHDRVVHPLYLRGVLAGPTGHIGIGYGKTLVSWESSDAEPVMNVVPELVRAASTLAGELWTLDGAGWIKRGSPADLQPVVQRPGLQALKAVEDRIYGNERHVVVAMDHQGGELWTLPLPNEISAMTADSRHVIAGDLRGRISVLSTEGVLLASLHAHERRVAKLLLDGDTLYSTGWDGMVRRMSLAPLHSPIGELVAERTKAWGL